MLVLVFWVRKGALLVVYQETSHTVTLVYDTELLRLENQEIGCEKLTRGALFHQDDDPVHTSTMVIAAIQECGPELYQQLPDVSPFFY